MTIKHMDKPEKATHLDEEQIQQALSDMEHDDGLRTDLEYVDTTLYSDRNVSFTEKHLIYLRNHPKVNPAHYLANLRTMVKIRT